MKHFRYSVKTNSPTNKSANQPANQNPEILNEWRFVIQYYDNRIVISIMFRK